MTKTLKEIAIELNTSASTISRVVNNRGNVNEKTRKRIIEGLKNSDYVPNQVARSLKAKSTKTIGIVVPDICERFFGQIIKGISRIVSDKGYYILLMDSDESSIKEEQILDLLFQQRVDALVMATVDLQGTKVMQFLNNNIPVVFIDNLPDIPVSYDAVLIDNVQASRMAVRQLISNGHRDIAIITGLADETTGYDRLLGYRLELHDNKIEVDENLIIHGNYKEDSGFSCMETLINNRKKHPFSAVYVTSELMTYGAIKAMKKHNLRFPDDIALIGFDVLDSTGFAKPGITTIRQPEQQIGEKTAEILLNHLDRGKANSKKLTGQKILLSPIIDIKDSCAINI